MFFILLCLGIATWYVSFRFKRRNMYRLASKIPLLDGGLPFVGVAHKLSGSTESILSTMQYYSYETMRNNGISRGWLGHLLYTIVLDPVDLEIILKTCLEKDNLVRFLKCFLGDGGIFATVAIWRRRRKVLVPAFSPKIVETFVEIFSKQSEILADRLSECTGRGEVSLWPYLSTYTLDAVCETVMGIKMKAQENPNVPFLKSMQIVLKMACERVFHLWLQPEWLYKFFPRYRTNQENIKVVHDFTDGVISKKREELKQKENPHLDVADDFGSYKKQSFLDHLIRISSNDSGGHIGYNNKELREEVLTLTIAGTDTSAVAIGYTLKLLAIYPKVQEKLQMELQEVYGDTDRRLVKDDFSQLKYLERVVKESLRLFPPVPFVLRKVLLDLTLPSGNILPAGSGIIISIWGVHRDPKYWGPDAECFDPDRFLPERVKNMHPCSFMPFSNGPRNCVGYQYALMSVKAAVSAVVRRYKIVGVAASGPVPQIKSRFDIMMKAIDDYEVILEKRDSCCCTK